MLRWIITNWLITDPNLIENPQKNYQTRQFNHVYLCGGRLLSAKQKPVNIGVGILMIAGGVLFWVFEASWLWGNISPAVVIITSYLWLLSILFFVKASSCDPGIAPTNIHYPFQLQYPHDPPEEYFNTVSLPYFSDRYKGTTVKYCPTCHIWRSPRMSHCGVCNTCVSIHDHHCSFLNNCVGVRNYRYFLWFLFFTVAVSIMISILGFIHVFHYRWLDNSGISSFGNSAAKNPVALLLAIYGLAAFIYPAMLLAFHVFLTANNITTREYLNLVRPSRNNSKNDRYVNIYNTGSIWKNWWFLWVSSPQGISSNGPRNHYISGDIRFEKIDPLQR